MPSLRSADQYGDAAEQLHEFADGLEQQARDLEVGR
jgi:hypothetical protein